ncbi:MAG: prephenate dehydrogenase/arogenate dehydrogenase family protein [Gammaproteobacteria bacterium]|nr:prephenate dehydrogenase/arogenate dehydrogenase family protein [Gammaproteobacteria bacterium]
MATLLLVGTGLIGGSFALAARRRGLFDRIDGIDTDARALADARSHGVVDAPGPEIRPDAVCVATPASHIASCVEEMGRRHPDAVLFDVGSVKSPVVDALRAGGRVSPRFVPCHPVVGSERSGPSAARADLFEGRSVVVTPVAETDAETVGRVSGWWRTVGARVTECPPGEHDRILAVTSHLPHLLAFALMEVLSDFDDETLRATVGGGFRDFSRIAASDPAIWSDILHENREAVLAWAEKLVARLAIDDDKEALRQRLADARERRRRLDV